MVKVDREAASPLYHQVYSELRDRILSGLLPFGASLPTEAQIEQDFAVSRATARKAMRVLRDHGLVERRRRIGTTVIHRSKKPSIDSTVGKTIDSLVAYANMTSVELIEFGLVAGAGDELASLELPAGSQVLCAVRVRSYQGEPLGVIKSVMPGSAQAYVTQERLRSTPLLQALLDQGLTIGGGSQSISVIGAGIDLASRLQIGPCEPILCVERLLRDADGTPLARTLAYYRGDRYQIVLGLEAVPHPLMQTSF